MSKRSGSLAIKNENEVSAMVQEYLAASLGYNQGALASEIANNINYYNGFPNGYYDDTNKEERSLGTNRSRYTSSDCFDKVEQAIPLLMQPFSGDEIVDCAPVRPGDEKIAAQATDMANYCFYKQNNGYLNLQTFIRDAAVCKVGVFKVYWGKKIKEEEEEYTELTDPEFLEIISDPDVDIISHDYEEEEELDESGVMFVNKTHELKIKRKFVKEYPVIECVAPENFMVIGKQISLDLTDCEFCAERIYATRETLVDLGIDPELINQTPESNLEMNNLIQIARYHYPEEQSSLMTTPPTNSARRSVELFRCLLRYDSDGDGTTELHEIYYSCNTILKNTIVSDVDYFAGTLLVQPHQFYGKSIVDISRQEQEVKTILMQECLNNFYYTNIPMGAYDINRLRREGEETMLNRQPGSCIPTDGNPAEILTFFPPSFTANSTLDLVQYFDRAMQSRTGISDMMAGLDPNVLNNNKGDQSISRIMTAAEQRVALMAKNLASTGLKDLFYYLIKLFTRHQRKKEVIRLRDDFVEVDPRSWNIPLDITIKVGIGTNEKEKQTMALNNVLQTYQTLYQANGFGVLFSEKNVYRAMIDLAKNIGVPFPEKYYQDPDSEESRAYVEQKANEPPPQDPQTKLLELQAQIESQKLQLQQQKQQQDIQLQQQKQQQDYELQVKKLELDKLKQEQTFMVDLEKLKLEAKSIEDKKDLDAVTSAVRVHDSIETHTKNQSSLENAREAIASKSKQKRALTQKGGKNAETPDRD